MGFAVSKERQDQNKRNLEIERNLVKEQRSVTIKLLLLGPGECGKSTVLKQMRIIHDNGFSKEEIESRKSIVYSNIVQSMCAIIKAMTLLKIEFSDPIMKKVAELVQNVMEEEQEEMPFTTELFKALKTLWTDSGVQNCYMRRNEYQLNDSAK